MQSTFHGATVPIPPPPCSFYFTSPMQFLFHLPRCSSYSTSPMRFLFHLTHAVSLPPHPCSVSSTSPMQFLIHLTHAVFIPPHPCSVSSTSPMQFLFHLPHRHCTSSVVDAHTYIVKRGTIQTVLPFCHSTCTGLLTPNYIYIYIYNIIYIYIYT